MRRATRWSHVLFVGVALPFILLGASSARAQQPPAPPASNTDINRQLLEQIQALSQRVSELEAQVTALSSRAARNSSSAAPALTADGKESSRTTPAGVIPPGITEPQTPTPAALYGFSRPETSLSDTALVSSAPTARSATPRAAVVAQTEKKAPAEPFAFADWSWLNGNPRETTTPLDTKLFTPEFRADVDYNYDFNHPQDDTIVGSTEVFRSNEVQVTQLGVGGDFHYDHVLGRLMTQFGMYAQTTPRNDASPARGQWNLDTAYRYISEAYGGYHFDALHGVNVEAGIFMSYIGLFSYYNYDNWAYQPSYVSSNTPWFFNGIRLQIFPTDKLKIEPWFINGWQSYGRFNKWPGMGGQILWRPSPWLAFVFNNYGMGTDTLGVPGRSRIHTDESVQVKYWDKPDHIIDKAAFSLTGDAGCEYGGGVSCFGNRKGTVKQSFLGFMVYNRLWFHNDLYGFTVGGGRINNPGRYLVLLPPINGATATSGTPYFTENPGDPFKAWDASGTFDYMPKQYITFRWEFDHRAANVPYWAGPGGVTPPGGNQGAPGSIVPGWAPDLRKMENILTGAILVKF